MAKLISDLEYCIGSECSYDDWTGVEGCEFRYPVHIRLDKDAEYLTKIRGRLGNWYSDIEPESIATMKYKFGSNHLFVGLGIKRLLEELEARYNLDFNKLEKERQNIIQEKNNLKKEINELNQKIININKKYKEQTESIISENNKIKNQLSQELEKSNKENINLNKKIIVSKLKIEELQNWINESKIIFKQYEKDKIRLNNLEKIYSKYQNLKNENENIINDIEKIKSDRNMLNKQNIVQKDLLEKYKNMNNELNKEKEDTKLNIEKLNKEIEELKYSRNKLKNQSENIHIRDEGAFKLKKIIENLKKQNKELEEQNKELIKRLDLKEKTGKVERLIRFY